LSVQLDWIRNELRELLDRFVNEAISRELSAFWQKLEDDLGASLEVEVVNVSDFVGATAVGDPPDTLLAFFFGEYLNMVGHNKRGVEANTELTDNGLGDTVVVNICTCFLHLLHECLRA
jgi:hypothetical protein